MHYVEALFSDPVVSIYLRITFPYVATHHS